jgi:hypothetical protein
VATQTIYFDSTNPSWLELPVADSTVSVSENTAEEIFPIDVYPNPASEAVYVITRNNMLNRFELFSASGRKIIDMQNPQLLTRIDLSNCRAGIYFLKAYTEAGISIRKFAVIKR